MNYNTTEVVYIHPVYNVCETVKAKVNLNRSSRSGYLSSLTSQNFSPPETTTKNNNKQQKHFLVRIFSLNQIFT